MINKVIYKGLKLQTDCRYYKFIEGPYRAYPDKSTSTYIVSFPKGSTNYEASKVLGLPCIGKPQTLEPTGTARRFKDVIISLNGLRLRKLTSDSHTINLIIVCDSDSRVVQTYDYTTIVVSQEDYKDENFINYLFYTQNLLYLEPYGPKPKGWEIRNFPKIIIGDSSKTLESESQEVYNLRRRYNDYVIREIDYQDQFILEMRRILDNYGMELVRINKEETLKLPSYITYQFNQTPTRYHHPNCEDLENRIMQMRLPVDFVLHTKDMVLFFDFKNKYNNLDILTNFCEFKASDKYGDRWTAAIKWSPITEDFNHIYQTDDNSNYAFQCQFRCELFFYEVLDDRYKFLEEIDINLNELGS